VPPSKLIDDEPLVVASDSEVRVNIECGLIVSVVAPDDDVAFQWLRAHVGEAVKRSIAATETFLTVPGKLALVGVIIHAYRVGAGIHDD